MKLIYLLLIIPSMSFAETKVTGDLGLENFAR